MRTYQFVTFAILLAVIGGALAWSKKKKPCGCGGAHPAETTIETPEE